MLLIAILRDDGDNVNNQNNIILTLSGWRELGSALPQADASILLARNRQVSSEARTRLIDVWIQPSTRGKRSQGFEPLMSLQTLWLGTGFGFAFQKARPV